MAEEWRVSLIMNGRGGTVTALLNGAVRAVMRGDF